MGLWYPKDTDFKLTAFSDSDHTGCLDSRKSTSGGIQLLGGDKLVSWSSKKQYCTSMSLAEADHSHLVQSSLAFPYQAHRCQISLHKGTVNEIRAERLARNVSPLALVDATQPKPNYNPPPSTTRSQVVTRSTRKETAILPSLPLESKHEVVSDEDDTLRDKEIAKLMALISKSFKKNLSTYNNTLRTIIKH
ncbi:hypothetical protein Tco_0707122 [Tanacetum coccineum]|uniref:Uncharacterized protein n=1 Tax=Tanacetum coccineum TaxID=301880 RepID=A0ABQ4YAY8_9ASTR